MAFMSHKFLPIVRIIEMEIPPANVLLFIEIRNDFVSQIPTFYFYVLFYFISHENSIVFKK